MKHILLLAFVALFSVQTAFAQLINTNPNPGGQPWYAGGFVPYTPEEAAAVPELKLPEHYRSKDLPVSVDNSTQPYFRSIFNQTDGSCSQASGIAYALTYELNYLRGLPSNTPQNQYPTHFTYNFLNNGSGQNGSNYFDGWDIAQQIGVPTVASYGGLASGGAQRWMTGYDMYYQAMQNRASEYFSISCSTPEGLETLKHWFNDHLDGSPVGGIAVFSAGATNYSMSYLPSGTPHAGQQVITAWGPQVNHAMTFVGYDDEICYDYNGDGQYTNDVDINNDGQVDMRDWEIGGLIVANSWSTWWGNSGKAYMMYKLLAENTTDGGVYLGRAHVVRPMATYEPQLAMRVKLKHASRQRVMVAAGISADVNADQPEYFNPFPAFCFQGGDYYMRGGYSPEDKIIEAGFDISHLPEKVGGSAVAKFFLMVQEIDPYNNIEDGQILEFSIIDYANGGTEHVCEQQNVTMSGITQLTIVMNVNTNEIETVENQPIEAVNYPNPFAGNTTIAFTTAQAGNVAVDIFNTNGQKVATLTNEHFPAGTHQLQWNGCSASGIPLPAGVYFFRLRSAEGTAYHKMIMIK